MSGPDRTREARLLDRYPDVRKAVVESPGFAAWRKTLRPLEIDGETFYVRGGDMLRDEDQLIVEWARRHGLLTDAAIAIALTPERE